MPLLAKLLTLVGASIFGLISSMFGAKIAVRLIAVATLAALYGASVVLFTTTITPWLSGVFTSPYGQLLGLLFPPAAGTVLASLSAYWIVVAGQRYTARLVRMAVG